MYVCLFPLAYSLLSSVYSRTDEHSLLSSSVSRSWVEIMPWALTR